MDPLTSVEFGIVWTCSTWYGIVGISRSTSISSWPVDPRCSDALDDDDEDEDDEDDEDDDEDFEEYEATLWKIHVEKFRFKNSLLTKCCNLTCYAFNFRQKFQNIFQYLERNNFTLSWWTINRIEFCQMKDPESFLALRGYSDLQGEKRRHLKILFVTSLYQPQQVCRSIHIYRHTVIVLRNTIHATSKCLI